MPISITDTDGGLGNILLGWGHVSDGDYLETLTRHLAQPDEKFGRYHYGFCDYSAVVSTDVSTASLQEVARAILDVASRHPKPVVAIVGGGDLVYGLARMTQALTQEAPWEWSVFRTREEGVDWIRKRVHERFHLDVLSDAELEAVIAAQLPAD